MFRFRFSFDMKKWFSSFIAPAAVFLLNLNLSDSCTVYPIIRTFKQNQGSGRIHLYSGFRMNIFIVYTLGSGLKHLYSKFRIRTYTFILRVQDGYIYTTGSGRIYLYSGFMIYLCTRFRMDTFILRLRNGYSYAPGSGRIHLKTPSSEYFSWLILWSMKGKKLFFRSPLSGLPKIGENYIPPSPLPACKV